MDALINAQGVTPLSAVRLAYLADVLRAHEPQPVSIVRIRAQAQARRQLKSDALASASFLALVACVFSLLIAATP
jgi:hypothetical protein